MMNVSLAKNRKKNMALGKKVLCAIFKFIKEMRFYSRLKRSVVVKIKTLNRGRAYISKLLHSTAGYKPLPLHATWFEPQ